jgi:cytochrome c-type biogenesis protein
VSAALGLAFLTGMLATVNPCGFAMLPTYLAYFIGSDASRETARPLGAGVRAGLALSAGFSTVFLTAGLLAAAGLRSISSALPWAAVGVGIILGIAGMVMVAGRQLPGTRLNLNRFLKPRTEGSGFKAVFGYGVAYAVAALSCSLALLLVVVAQAASTGSAAGMLAVFAAYALGSTVVLMLLSVGAALAREALARRVRRLLPLVHRLSGAALVLAGIYLVLYWAPALSGNAAGGILGAPIGALSAAVSGFVAAAWPFLAAASLAALAAAALRPRRAPRKHTATTGTNK